MSLDSANPTGVNSFNGLSDDSRASTHFENLWNAGAFNPDGKPDAAQGQSPQPAPVNADPAAPVEPAQAAPQPPENPPQNEEGPEYVDLDDYLAKSNIERESFLSIPVAVKVDGKTETIPLAEVVKGYSREADYTRKTQLLAEQQKSWEAQQQQAQKVWQEHLERAQTLANLAHQQLLAEFQGVDWNKLRMEDPIAWSVRTQEFNTKAGQIQHFLQQAESQRQQQLQQQQAEQSKQLAAQREKMLEARPEWRDNTKFQAARGEIASYARSRGYSDAEIGALSDHRLVLALHDASRWAQLQAQAPQAVKRVRAAPQSANPGARIQRDPAQAARSQAKEQFLKNRKNPDAQVAYFNTLA